MTTLRTKPRVQQAGATLIVAIILWTLCFAFGRRHVGGFDHSVLVDVCWRLQQGQVPFTDFPCTLPPAWVIGIRLSNALFGASWDGLLILHATYASLLFLWSVSLLRGSQTTNGAAIVLAASIQVPASVVTSYWWYNSMTSATACVATLAVTSQVLSRGSARSCTACALILAVLMGTKPNVAIPLVATLFLSLAAGIRTIGAVRALGIPVTATFIAAFALWVSNINPFEVFDAYRSISGRGLTLSLFMGMFWGGLPAKHWLVTGLMCAVTLAAVGASFFGRVRGQFREAIPAIGLSGVAAIAVLTNGEHKLVDLAMAWGAAVAFAASRSNEAGSPLRTFRINRGIITAAAIAWIIVGVVVGQRRERVRFIGKGTFYERTEFAESTKGAFFRNIRAGARFFQVDCDIHALLLQVTPVNPFFGPRLQWAYAEFELPSPREEPVWWHAGVAYAANEEGKWVENWIRHRHDFLVFLPGDRTYLPSTFLEHINRYYAPMPSGPSIEAFRLIRDPAESPHN